MTVALYLLGKKGFKVLESIIDIYGVGKISCVIIGRDKNIENDYYNRIVELCIDNKVPFVNRGNEKTIESEFSIAIGWRWMIDNNKNLIVLHDSLLPEYRGFSPLVNMLINGESKIGVTALYASEEYDRGDILLQESEEINYPIKIADAIDIVSEIYIRVAIKVYSSFVSDFKIERVPQNDEEATYSLWRNEGDYLIDWSEDANDIMRFVNSVSYPYRGAKCYFEGIAIRILDVSVIKDVVVKNRKNNIGKLIFLNHGKPIIVCGKGLLMINDYKFDNPEEKRELPFRLILSDKKGV